MDEDVAEPVISLSDIDRFGKVRRLANEMEEPVGLAN
jgi:hypothetical protein